MDLSQKACPASLDEPKKYLSEELKSQIDYSEVSSCNEQIF